MILNVISDSIITLNTYDWVAWLNINEGQEDSTNKSFDLAKIEVKGSTENYAKLKNINLNYDQNSISFYFPNLNYKAHNLNRYRYKLIGLENDWIENQFSPFASYNNLLPGKYEFHAQTSYNNNEWISAGVHNVKIKQLWWMSRWFKITLGALGISAIWVIYRVRTNQIRRVESMKIQMAELEMEALRAQMNPHFIFNALNSVKHFILSNDKFLAAEYLSNFSLLVRKILNNSKSSIINLEEEISTINLYLEMEKLRYTSKFKYDITIDENIHLEEIMIPPLILQPFVENAIWHGLMHKEETGLLKINVQKDGNQVICIIEDNGIGREKAKALKTRTALNRKSYGMQITQSRIEKSPIKIRSEIIDLKNEQGLGIGTRIIIYLPIQNQFTNG
jgi:hypothetical protein